MGEGRNKGFTIVKNAMRGILLNRLKNEEGYG